TTGVAAASQRVDAEQQEDNAQEQQHHHHCPQRQTAGIGYTLIHRAYCNELSRAALAFCRLARSRRSRLTSIGSAARASGRSTSALSTWEYRVADIENSSLMASSLDPANFHH